MPTYTAHTECAYQLDHLLRAIESGDWRSAALHADLLKGYAAGAVQQSVERGRATGIPLARFADDFGISRQAAHQRFTFTTD